MATATLINVPDAILQKYGTQIDFSLVRIIPPQGSKKSYEAYAHEINTLCDQIDRGEVETYGPFEGRAATDFLRQFI